MAQKHRARPNQILLDDPLYYTGGPAITHDQELVDVDYTDIRADRSLKTIHRVPDIDVDGVETDFDTPTAFQSGSVEAFLGKKLVDPATLSFPGGNTVRFAVAPEGPPLEIRYLPNVGIATGHIRRRPSIIVYASATLTLSQIDGTTVYIDTNGGQVDLVLPVMTAKDGVTAIFIKDGLDDATIQADAADTIGGESGPVTIERAKKLHYVERLNEWVAKQKIEEADFSFRESPSADEELMPITPET